MKNSNHYLLLLICLIAYIGQGFAQTTQPTVKDSIIQEGKEKSLPKAADLLPDDAQIEPQLYLNVDSPEYTFKYNVKWDLSEEPSTGIVKFIIKSPLLDSLDLFQENINLVTELETTQVSEEKYYDMTLKQLENMVNDFYLVERTKDTTATNVVYTQMVFGGWAGIPIQFYQRYYKENGKLYVLTFSAEKEKYDDYLPEAIKMMDSFEIKELTEEELANTKQLIRLEKTERLIETDAFKVACPAGWTSDLSGKMGSLFFLIAPFESNEDKVQENVNLMKEDLTGRDYSLEEYTDFSIEQVKQVFEKVTLEKKEKVRLNDQETILAVYQVKQGELEFYLSQYFMFIKTNAYVLTLTAEPNNENHKQDWKVILESFELK